MKHFINLKDIPSVDLKKIVAEEQEGKYRAYIKFADIQQELKVLKDSTK